MGRTTRAAACAVGGLALGAPAAEAQGRVLAEVLRPTPVSVYAGNVVFSAWDPAIAKYRLMLSVDGLPPDPLPVRPRDVPFDVDVGPGLGGLISAVYSRCRVEPRLDRIGNVLPAWNTARGCDLYRTILTEGSERRLSSISTQGSSEFLPSIWRDKIAFARRFERRDGARGRRPYLYFASTTLAARSRRLPRPPFGARTGSASIGQPVGIDVRGFRVAYVWNRLTGRRAVSELRTVTPGGLSERLELVTARPGIGELMEPTQVSRRVVVSGHTRVDAPQTLARYRLGEGQVLRRAIGPQRLVLTVTRDGTSPGTTLVLDAPQAARALGPAQQCQGADGTGRCRIIALDGDPFSPGAPGTLPADQEPAQGPGPPEPGILDALLTLPLVEDVVSQIPVEVPGDVPG